MTDPVISTGELAARLGDGRLKLVDGSWFLDGRDARAAWRAERLPGAVFFDLEALSDRSSPLPHMLPNAADFASAVGAMGIGREAAIVVYDQAGLFSAARVWWTFRAFGAEDVRVLDGGLPKWRAEGRPLDSGGPDPAPARFDAVLNESRVRDLDQVARALTSGSAQVLDARPTARFRGEAPEPRAGLRSGHMPGALNLPFGAVLNADGTLKDAEALRAAFEGAGVDLSRPVTTTCGSGVTAAILTLALARLGIEAPVYDGSWAEWGGRQDTPVATA